MKKLTLITVITLISIISTPLFSTTYTIKTTNGSSQGYNHTSYKIKKNGDVSIIYKDPGFEKLPLDFAINTESKSTQILNAEKTLQLLLTKIESGTLEGKEKINGNMTKWKVDSKELLNAEITIVQE